MWKFACDLPIYVQLVEKIEQQIIEGTYPKGSKLPSVRELASRINVNPNTIQKAFALLEEKGLVITNGTSGRSVTDDAVKIAKQREETAKRHTEHFLLKMLSLGFDEKQILQSVKQAYKEGRYDANEPNTAADQ